MYILNTRAYATRELIWFGTGPTSSSSLILKAIGTRDDSFFFQEDTASLVRLEDRVDESPVRWFWRLLLRLLPVVFLR